MIKKLTDINKFLLLMGPYLPIEGLDPLSWLGTSENICLIDNKDNLSLFECVKPDVFEGHLFFKSRGEEALARAKDFLNCFQNNYKPQIIKGLTPLEHLGARWMSRQLGFKSYGVVQTLVGPCELFILTKKDWENTLHE